MKAMVLAQTGSIEERLDKCRLKLGIKAKECAELLRPTRHVEQPQRDVDRRRSELRAALPDKVAAADQIKARRS
jgi:hypothetical protein